MRAISFHGTQRARKYKPDEKVGWGVYSASNFYSSDLVVMFVGLSEWRRLPLQESKVKNVVISTNKLDLTEMEMTSTPPLFLPAAAHLLLQL